VDNPECLCRCIGCGTVTELHLMGEHFQVFHKGQSVYAHVYWRIPTKNPEWWR
jgi:hypothetical protein